MYLKMPISLAVCGGVWLVWDFFFFGNPFPLSNELHFSGYISVFFQLPLPLVKNFFKKGEKHF